LLSAWHYCASASALRKHRYLAVKLPELHVLAVH
jgi:hypothetical protein